MGKDSLSYPKTFNKEKINKVSLFLIKGGRMIYYFIILQSSLKNQPQNNSLTRGTREKQ